MLFSVFLPQINIMKQDRMKRVRVSQEYEINLADHPDVLKMVDQMRKTPSGEKISRAAQIRICIRESYQSYLNTKK